jgi:hypothetical protein
MYSCILRGIRGYGTDTGVPVLPDDSILVCLLDKREIKVSVIVEWTQMIATVSATNWSIIPPGIIMQDSN